MKKLCVFTLYAEKGASSRYRAYIYKDEFEKNFETQWFSFWPNIYVSKYMHNKKKYILHILALYVICAIKRLFQLVVIAPKADVLFVQKGTIPKIKKTFLERAKNKNVRIIFDVDDAIYTISKDNSSKIAEIADCVLCGNDTLYNYYRKYNEKCLIIPTVEQTLKYEPFWTDTFPNKIIGWIGSKTTLDNFDLIIEALNHITNEHPEIKIAIISNTALDYTKKIKNSYLVKWDQSTYVREISKFTIGIMPLKDNAMNRGKCGFKLIQYLNMKKPVIGSGVGVNSGIIEGNGIVANSTEEWISAIEKLMYDKEYYGSCINHIDEVFFETYHFLNVSNKLVEILLGD